MTDLLTLAGRIRSALTAAGYPEYERYRTPRYPDQTPAFFVAEGVGATVITHWRDAPGDARAQVLAAMASVLLGSGLSVDRRDGHLYVHDPAKGAVDG